MWAVGSYSSGPPTRGTFVLMSTEYRNQGTVSPCITTQGKDEIAFLFRSYLLHIGEIDFLDGSPLLYISLIVRPSSRNVIGEVGATNGPNCMWVRKFRETTSREEGDPFLSQRGLPLRTSAKISDFLIPSPPCPQIHATFLTKVAYYVWF